MSLISDTVYFFNLALLNKSRIKLFFLRFIFRMLSIGPGEVEGGVLNTEIMIRMVTINSLSTRDANG